MADQVETLLEALGGAVRGTEPPEAFLRAVAHRRVRRRVVRVAAVGALLIVPVVALTVWGFAGPTSRTNGPTERPRARARLSEDSVLVLTRLNAGRDELILPRMAFGIGGPPIRAGARWDAAKMGGLLGP